MGIDIAADTFTATWRASGGEGVPPSIGEQTPTGRAGLQQRLQATGQASAATLVVLEATGPYWIASPWASTRRATASPWSIPTRRTIYAKAQLWRAKTDALDARDLAPLAATLQPTPWTLPPAVYHDVSQRLVARDASLAMRTQARNQRHALLQWPVVIEGARRLLDALIADLDRRIARLDAEFAAVLKESTWLLVSTLNCWPSRRTPVSPRCPMNRDRAFAPGHASVTMAMVGAAP